MRRHAIALILTLACACAFGQRSPVGTFISGTGHGDPETEMEGHLKYSGGEFHFWYMVPKGRRQYTTGVVYNQLGEKLMDQIDQVMLSTLPSGQIQVGVRYYPVDHEGLPMYADDKRLLTIKHKLAFFILTPSGPCPDEPKPCKATYTITEPAVKK